MTDLSDEALMRLYQGGASDAFNRLFVRHTRDLYLVLCSLLGNTEPARELSSQTWRQVHRLRHSFDGKQPFRSWLFGLAVGLRRAQARAQSVTASQPGEIPAVTDSASLLQALRALPESYREVWVLHHYAGLRCPEIARALGASEQAVQQRFEQAERLLLASPAGVPSRALLAVAPATLDEIARAILPVVSQPRATTWPSSLVFSCLLFGIGLVLLFVRLHR
jgi:RNA polymerase sigma-70 factor (ECF subfamily)